MGKINKTISLKPRHIQIIDKKPRDWKLSKFLQNKLDEENNKMTKKRLSNLLEKYNDKFGQMIGNYDNINLKEYYDYISEQLLLICNIHEKPNLTNFVKEEKEDIKIESTN